MGQPATSERQPYPEERRDWEIPATESRRRDFDSRDFPAPAFVEHDATARPGHEDASAQPSAFSCVFSPAPCGALRGLVHAVRDPLAKQLPLGLDPVAERIARQPELLAPFGDEAGAERDVVRADCGRPGGFLFCRLGFRRGSRTAGGGLRLRCGDTLGRGGGRFFGSLGFLSFVNHGCFVVGSLLGHGGGGDIHPAKRACQKLREIQSKKSRCACRRRACGLFGRSRRCEKIP